MLSARLIDKTKSDLVRFRGTVDIGFLDTLNENIILKAAVNEFGSKTGIPERPFMRSAFDENKKKILRYISKLAPSVLMGVISKEDFFRKLGRFVKELIEYKILVAKSWAVPLSPVTIREKGHDKPLVDTYEMVTSLDIRIQ